MQRKPVILILTSTDRPGDAAYGIADAVRAAGTHNAVVLDESRYGAGLRSGKLGRAVCRADMRRLSALRAPSPASLARRKGRLFGRNMRIANAVKRYAPQLVLTTTPFSHAAYAVAARKAALRTPSMHLVMSFTLPEGKDLARAADAYIVENPDMKDELVRRGISTRRVSVLGLPFDAEPPTEEEAENGKRELGLPCTPTVFVNAGDKAVSSAILGLLVDQGDIINIVCYVRDVRALAALRALADGAETRSNVVLVTRRELFDEYLLMSDIVVTQYDPSVIYKCFKAGKPVISFGNGGTAERDLEYLAERKLIMRARSDIDVVAPIYKLMQPERAAEYAQRGRLRTELFSVENTANYIIRFAEADHDAH